MVWRMERLRWWGRVTEEESLGPDVRRAVRSTVGLMVPLGLATVGWLPFETAFVVVAAHSMTLVDVRGAYPVRFGFLLAMVLVLGGTTLLGTVAAGHVWTAVAVTALVAVNSGVWRHLTPEYGPALATPAGLLFFMALMYPHGEDHALAVLVGGMWGLVVQVAMWPIRHEHPLRRVVAESWVAAGELFGAYVSEVEGRQERIGEKEAALRGAVDQGYEVLAGARGRRRANVERLERLHLEAARLATEVGALGVAVEGERERGVGEAWGVVAESLGNTARAVAVAVVSRQPAHLAVAEVRLRRAGGLLESLKGRLGDGVAGGIVGQVEGELAEVGKALRGVVDRAGERAIFPLELLDLNTWRLRPLAAVLNLSRRPDPAIVRFTLRSAVVTMIAVALAKMWVKIWEIPHGYWLPYTVVVVLQADYGATRLRAVQRLSGTLLGVVLGSGLLMLRLPAGVILGAVGGTGLLFGYFMRRNYAVAVVFITLFVVLLTEAHQQVTVALTEERLGATVAGGVLAMAAAMVFWPTWERNRLPGLLAAAVRANREYLRVLAELIERGADDHDRRIAGKRAAERANREVFGSLERLYADPASRREGAERAAVLANGNQRLTRALNVMSVRLEAGGVSGDRGEAVAYARRLMGVLSEVAERRGGEVGEIVLPRGNGWVAEQLLRAGTEVAAIRGKAGGAFVGEGVG